MRYTVINKSTATDAQAMRIAMVLCEENQLPTEQGEKNARYFTITLGVYEYQASIRRGKTSVTIRVWGEPCQD